MKFSQDLQAVIRLANALTPELVSTAQALVVSDYSSTQAAELLEITPAAVRKRLERLRLRIEAALNDYAFSRSKSPEGHLAFGADDRAYRFAASPSEAGETRP